MCTKLSGRFSKENGESESHLSPDQAGSQATAAQWSINGLQ